MVWIETSPNAFSFCSVRDIFLCKPDLESETALNVAAIFPAAKIATVDYHATAKDLEFSPGEIFLQSMAKQLKKIDNCRGEANGYKADGLIRINTIRNMEVVLFETSGGVKGGSKRKQTFDFHKGMFGLVSMLKALADTFPYASYERMSAIKIYFVHTCGT